MKNFKAVLAAVFMLSPALALAQGSSGAGALANSQSGASAGATSGAAAQSGSVLVLNQYSTQRDNNGNVLGSPDTPYTSELRNVPAVSPPAVFGGGHPCLAGKSGGIAVAGFGGSYGEGSPEPVCMLWYMGQPEAAIRLLVMTDGQACKALGNVGYYRVGKAVVPFACGETVKGGVDTPGFTFKNTKVSTRNGPPETSLRPKARPALYSKCSFEGGKIRIQIKRGIDQASAIRACRSALGNPAS